MIYEKTSKSSATKRILFVTDSINVFFSPNNCISFSLKGAKKLKLYMVVCVCCSKIELPINYAPETANDKTGTMKNP